MCSNNFQTASVLCIITEIFIIRNRVGDIESVRVKSHIFSSKNYIGPPKHAVLYNESGHYCVIYLSFIFTFLISF